MTPNRTIDYAEADEKYLKEHGLKGFAYYDDKLQRAKNHGYYSFIDAVKDLYPRCKSGRKAGSLLGVTINCIINHANNLGIVRPKGGNNNPGNGEVIKGPVCKNCGSTKRYKSNPNHCIPCHRKKNREAYQKRKSAGQTTTGARL